MDMRTIIFMLALNLVAIGSLLLLISSRMTEAWGQREFGLGMLLLGVTYFTRFFRPVNAVTIADLCVDALIVAGSMILLRGMSLLAGRSPIATSKIGLAVPLYLVVAGLIVAQWGVPGRYAFLNLLLGLMFTAISWTALRSASRETGSQKLPLATLALVFGVLALVSIQRVAVVLYLGLGGMFEGTSAGIYLVGATLVTVTLGPCLLWIVFLRLNARLSDQAMQDPLTGLLNRRGLEYALSQYFLPREERSLIVLHIDLDHFKRVNDTYGHMFGDHVLQGMAAVLLRQLRAGDLVARVGGEEFILACAGADLAAAMTLAERLRSAIAGETFTLPEGEEFQITASVGVSQPFSSAAEFPVALQQSDDALYRAKHAGRNRVFADAPAAAEMAPA